MKKSIFIMLYLAIFPIFKAQADSLIRIKCDDQDVGTKVYFNNKLAGECPFDKFIPEGKISIRAHKMVNSDYEQFFNKEVFTVEGGIQKIDLILSSPQLTADGKMRQEADLVIQQAKDVKLREQQRIIKMKQQAEAKNAARIKAENAQGVFIDNENNLMWQDDEDAKNINMLWNNAMNYCQQLTLADYDDWRLPAGSELSLLYLKRTSLKNIATGNWVFPRYYWSSTEYKDYYALRVSFSDGVKKYLAKDYDTNFVRCVRNNK